MIPPPLSLYVHIPWCTRKCPYCDFNSHTIGEGGSPGDIPEATYLARLLEDLDADLDWAQGRPLQSIFIGGGTPSLFSGAAIAELIEGATQRLPLARGAELTLEANPGSAEQNRFADYRAAGINRLSIGVQSFAPDQLRNLGRSHSAEEAIGAVEAARAAGFDNLNLDLMQGLPGQTPEQAVADLQRAISLGPEHLSWYQLSIEPNTVFFNRPPRLPDEDILEDIEQRGTALLEAAGYHRYEVSAFARGGRTSAHNLNYWEFGDYLGIGAGAHGKLSLPAGMGGAKVLRVRKKRQPTHYLEAIGGFRAETRELTRAELPGEFMLGALRLIAGASPGQFEERTGLSLTGVAEALARTRARGLLEPRRLQATPLGLRYLNDLLGEFLND